MARKRRSIAKWKRDNPHAVAAHRKLNAAVKSGLITPQPCERCGATPADGPHESYSEPLAVRWLCRRHDNEIHRELREARRGR